MNLVLLLGPNRCHLWNLIEAGRDGPRGAWRAFVWC